jgi:hypothetical protein
VPLDNWLRNVGRDLTESILSGLDGALVQPSAARRVAESHWRGQNHTARLWRLLAFEVWRQHTLPRLRSAGCGIATPQPDTVALRT